MIQKEVTMKVMKKIIVGMTGYGENNPEETGHIMFRIGIAGYLLILIIFLARLPQPLCP